MKITDRKHLGTCDMCARDDEDCIICIAKNSTIWFLCKICRYKVTELGMAEGFDVEIQSSQTRHETGTSYAQDP